MIFIKFTTYLLMAAAATLMLISFVFTLFFGVATLGAIAQLSFIQLIVLMSFSIVFSIAGSSFLTLTELLYSKVRR